MTHENRAIAEAERVRAKNRHVLEVREDDWALEHPAQCREDGSLLDCDTHRAVKAYERYLPGEMLGRWYVMAKYVIEGDGYFFDQGYKVGDPFLEFGGEVGAA